MRRFGGEHRGQAEFRVVTPQQSGTAIDVPLDKNTQEKERRAQAFVDAVLDNATKRDAVKALGQGDIAVGIREVMDKMGLPLKEEKEGLTIDAPLGILLSNELGPLSHVVYPVNGSPRVVPHDLGTALFAVANLPAESLRGLVDEAGQAALQRGLNARDANSPEPARA